MYKLSEVLTSKNLVKIMMHMQIQYDYPKLKLMELMTEIEARYILVLNLLIKSKFNSNLKLISVQFVAKLKMS